MTRRASQLIGFDGAIFAAGPPSGVALSFLATLSAYASESPNRSVLLLPHGTARPEGLPAAVDHRFVPRAALRGVGRSLHLPRRLQRLGIALWHSPVAAIPWRAPCPTVATVHDLPWLVSPRLRESGCGYRHRFALRVAMRYASAITTPSRFTADAVKQSHRGRPSTLLEVIPHGLPTPESAPPPQDSDRDGPLLVFGDHRPRKNLERLRRAYELAVERRPNLPRLRIVGPGIDYVDRAMKTQLLRTARALIVPSLHEGFGLPLLEAFGHGLPVACSDRASLPEVAGPDAAMFFDPLDVEQIAAAMVRIDSETDLRNALREAGLKRARQFTATRSAAGWAALHERLLSCG